MKRSKRLCALLGALVVICAATFAASRIEERRENIQASGEIILSVSPDEVQSVKWEYGETSLAFHRDGGWLYDGDEAFPVSGEKLEDMLDIFSAFGVSFIIEDVTDTALYGLDEPECVIEFSTENGTYTVTLGDYSKMDQERYISIGDGKVYLAKVDPLEEFDAGLDDVMLHDSSLSYEQVSRIRFEGAESYTIVREEDSADACFSDDLYYTEHGGMTVPLDSSRVSSYLSELKSLELSSYVSYNVSDEELEACGLLSPELTVTVDYTAQNGAEETFVLHIGYDQDEQAAAEEAEANGEEPGEVTAYVRVGDSQIVYRVSKYSAAALQAVSFNELRHREVLTADFDSVVQIDVTLEDTVHTMIAEAEDTWTYNGEAVEIADLQKELEGLSVEYAADFTNAAPAGKLELGLTVHLSSESRPTVQIELYRHDSVHCLALVDGEPLALVPRGDVVDLIEAVNTIVLD